MKRAALLSVSDRFGLVELARTLAQHGYQLLTTSGTGKCLSEAGIEHLAVERYTGQREILDGRVKTLHPKIHAGILARRDKAEHMRQLEADDIAAIDVVAVNLYPFIQGLTTDKAGDPERMVELVDVGGPTMIRAAAKNFKGVVPLIDPADYRQIIEFLRRHGSLDELPLDARAGLAAKVFARTAQYDLEIARYFSTADPLSPEHSTYEAPDPAGGLGFGEISGVVLRKAQSLRYGENPHQKAALYLPLESAGPRWRQLSGKELSYNNLLDFDAAFRLILAFAAAEPTVVILKHLNPCGAASRPDLASALQAAKGGDPRSHFGGIIAFNQKVGADAAALVSEDFAELVIAPAFQDEALEILRKRKNLRILTIDFAAASRIEMRSVQGGVLIQQSDTGVSDVSQAELVSQRRPSASELADLQFAWTVCGGVKSNAVVLVRERTLIGTGAGQMSRIDSTEFAICKAKTHQHPLAGSVAASDAFFPFPDGIEALAKDGITAVVAPGGSLRDGEVIAAANRLNVSLLFTGDRHFRH